jgi:N-acetylglucosamine-6-phosphate deacetylase
LIPNEFVENPAPVSALPGFSPADILLNNGRIEAVLPVGTKIDAERFDATDKIVLPGFIDIHVHGGDGCDTMDASATSLASMASFFAQHGVTGYAPTTMTAEHDDTLAAVQAVNAYVEKVSGPATGARILGIHLEGPFISPAFPGAQLAESIREPNVDEFAELANAGPVCMMTLAPEQPGAHELMAIMVEDGIAVVVGHTDASYEQATEAIKLGASQATHTYNAMTGLHHRRPGTLGAVLSNDAIYAQLIADNIHVHPAAMNVLARCKGVERTILITDAMRAAGLPTGEYDLGGQPVTVKDGQCRLHDGTLAGSVLTMEQALTNFMAASGWPLAKAWPTSSRTAATALGRDDELGSIAPGYLADLVVLDQSLQVSATIVGGDIVWQRL